jgi:hypothetical protein
MMVYEELRERVEDWRRYMLENPPPKPKTIEFPEEPDYYDEEKLGLLP